MDPLHEAVKMDPAFLFDGQGFIEQVHQPGFATPDISPHVNAPGGVLLVLKQFCDSAAKPACPGFSCLEFEPESVQGLNGHPLLRISAELAAGNQFKVGIKRRCRGVAHERRF